MRDCVEKCDGGRMVGIAQGELHFNMEHSSIIKSALRTSNVGVPGEEIILQWASNNTNSRNLLIFNFIEVLEQPFVGVGLEFFVGGGAQQGLISGSSSFLHE